MTDIVERLRGCANGLFWPEARDAIAEIGRLQRELSDAEDALTVAHMTGVAKGKDEGRRQAFDEVGLKAREYAAHYPEASDGRNTFIIFAEWAEGRL